MRYRSKYWGFELDLPPGWAEPGCLWRLLFLGWYALQAVHPEFYGPNGSSIKFAIGPIVPEPTVEEQKKNLERIALKYGHTILTIGEIEAADKKHATITCELPLLGVMKNYSPIFDGIEYFVTARGDISICDSIVKTFKPSIQ